MNPVIAPTPGFAIVNGSPYNDLPEDLYIPPDALEVLLDTFEGPLDLLLYLIRRQNLDILNIPIAEITHQYITYIQLMTVLNLELAAEYLVMAALLAEIKSRLLLPRPPGNEMEEEEDPKATLIRRLQEYECIKNAAEEIELLPRLERDLFTVDVDTSILMLSRALPDIQLQEMINAFQNVLKRVEQHSHHHIIKEPLSVRERMSFILESLITTDNCLFSKLLYRREGRHGVVVSFLAILELAKEGLIEILQDQPYSEIRVRTTCTAVTT
jgi:segregation and condensation protein A